MSGAAHAPGSATFHLSDRRALIAVDLGAESCRVSLLRWSPDPAVLTPQLDLVYRFANGPVRAADGTLRWPLKQIVTGVEEGIRRSALLAPEGIRSLAVDGWAVDFVRLQPQQSFPEDPFCYRDDRARAAYDTLHRHLPPDQLRAITGVERQPLNTIYQLYADHLDGRAPLPWLNLPEFLLHRWGAPPVAEYTNASHTALVDLQTGDWSRDVFNLAGLDLACAAPIVPAGTILGSLQGPLAHLPGLQHTQLIAPACHDTASAIAGIAEPGDDWAYISCGTWSLVGTMLRAPLNTPAVREDNFTNLAAVGGATCFHKSVNGMWLLKQCMDAWAEQGRPWALPALLAAAEAQSAPQHLLHVDDPALLGIGDMPGRINAHLRSRGLPSLSPASDAAPTLVSLLLHSLAQRYADVLRRIQTHSGKTFQRIAMVGGGAQNNLLRRLTQQTTGLPVIVGPSESSTIGNFAIQLAALERTSDDAGPTFARRVTAWAHRIGSVPFHSH